MHSSYKKPLQCIAFASFFILLSFQNATATLPGQQQANEDITKLYHRLNDLPIVNMSSRLDNISAQFLGTPYSLGALGEGDDARFDQRPWYRMDAFDCDTYVTTVLALTLAKDVQGFKQCMRKIRYQNGQINFIARNHFISLDWNPGNQRQGFIKDITGAIKDRHNQSVVKIASALIDKPSWYQHFSSDIIRLYPHNAEEKAKRWAELKAKGQKLARVKATIPYIPLTLLFDSNSKPNLYLFKQIPNGAIVEIIRPDWNLRERIGTNLNVSHLGFAIWKNNVLYYRQASSQYGQVIDLPMIEYLQKALTSPTIKGIHIEVLVPEHPLSSDCIVKQ